VAGVLSVALVATAIAFHSGPGKTSGATTTTPPSRTLTTARPTPRALPDPVTPIAVSVYDSDDGSEGLGTAGRLLTGGPGWQTNQYCQDYATRGGVLKSTGLIFDLGAPTRITGATVDIGIPGADLELWAADPSVTAWPAVRHQPPAGFTKVASSPAAHTGGTTVFTFADVTTRYVLVWFNGRLPVTPNPNRAILCAHSDGNLYGDSITAVRFSRG
jgi:hypothetical protein